MATRPLPSSTRCECTACVRFWWQAPCARPRCPDTTEPGGGRQMKRLAMALGVALFASPVPLFAQTPVFTVQAASADVYKAPSTGSVVIGHAPRGTTLPVTRELGSWVKVSWPRAEDGVGYVHVS